MATHAQELAARQDKAIRRIEARRKERRTATAGDTSKSLTRTRRNEARDRIVGSPFEAPYVRKGQSIMSSDGYQFHKLAALAIGALQPEDCKEELYTAMQLDDTMRLCPGWRKTAKSFTAPFCPALMMGHDGVQYPGKITKELASELSQKMWAPHGRFDPDEADAITRKAGVDLTSKGYTPDTLKYTVGATGQNQSWMQQAYGGALIPPPEFGPLIPLLRNTNAMLTAGATVVPLPPGGRITMPRQNTASLVYHAGEGQAGTQTDVQTDQFTLSPKKLIGLFVVNNELLRYGGPQVEQLFRNDMTLSLSLQLDFDCLQGAGSNNVVAGLISYPGVQNYTTLTNPGPGGIGSTGNTFQAVDVYNMQGYVFTANAPEFTAWVFHPLLAAGIAGARAGSGAGASTGPFLFDLVRSVDNGVLKENLSGAKFVRSTNAPTNRVKSTATTLTTVFGGWFPNYYLGMYGTVEIALAEQGTPYFSQDQTQIRAILAADGGPRNPGTFIYYDQVINGAPVT